MRQNSSLNMRNLVKIVSCCAASNNHTFPITSEGPLKYIVFNLACANYYLRFDNLLDLDLVDTR
jgi:hypothetical protein